MNYSSSKEKIRCATLACSALLGTLSVHPSFASHETLTESSISPAAARHLKYTPSHDSRASTQWINTHLPKAKAQAPTDSHRLRAATLLPHVDLRSSLPPAYDQGQLGSCTAHALAVGIQHVAGFMPSRLAIYYGERKIEGTVAEDAGASLTDGIAVLHQMGACHESLWPYSDNGVQFKLPPSAACLADASQHKDIDPLNVGRVNQDLASIKQALAQHPIALGIMIYDSFLSATTAKTGVVNLPSTRENLLGGHAVALVGYDDRPTINGKINPNFQRFIVRNSWGPNWGQGGHFTLPYSYVLNPNLAVDFWKITKMT